MAMWLMAIVIVLIVVLGALPDCRPPGAGPMSAAAGRLARGILGGYFLLMVMFLYAPIVVLVIFSFNDNTTPTLPLAGFTTHWYHLALGNDLLSPRSSGAPRWPR